MERRINEFLKAREVKHLRRELIPITPLGGGKILADGREYVNFSSNDYLGLASHPELIRAAVEALSPVVGSAGSRLMTGSTSMHHALEERVAEFKGKSAAIVFNSGYQANVGIISALCGKDDNIFSDRLNHASIVDGIRLSGARVFRFRHNDVEHLEELLIRAKDDRRRTLIVTETVFSMDGDFAPLEEIVRLKKKYGCMLMVDEAHATGIFGYNGSGLLEETGMTDASDIVMGTFSKALGSFGAYAAMSCQIRDYLVNTCRSFIYSTALPPSVIAAGVAALDLINSEPRRRKELLLKAGYLRGILKRAGCEIRGDSQIVPVMIGDSGKTVRISEYLKDKGYWVTPVRPPTVPEGQARLRISVTFDHGKETLDRFAEVISKLGQ